jgi:hypothetical protein
MYGFHKCDCEIYLTYQNSRNRRLVTRYIGDDFEIQSHMMNIHDPDHGILVDPLNHFRKSRLRKITVLCEFDPTNTNKSPAQKPRVELRLVRNTGDSTGAHWQRINPFENFHWQKKNENRLEVKFSTDCEYFYFAVPVISRHLRPLAAQYKIQDPRPVGDRRTFGPAQNESQIRDSWRYIDPRRIFHFDYIRSACTCREDCCIFASPTWHRIYVISLKNAHITNFRQFQEDLLKAHQRSVGNRRDLLEEHMPERADPRHEHAAGRQGLPDELTKYKILLASAQRAYDPELRDDLYGMHGLGFYDDEDEVQQSGT